MLHLKCLRELSSILREQIEGTEVVMVDQSFTDQLELDLGGLMVRLMKFGPAHSPGDISVVVPERNVLIAGDIAFNQRMLPVFTDTDTAAWVETWQKKLLVGLEQDTDISRQPVAQVSTADFQSNDD